MDAVLKFLRKKVQHGGGRASGDPDRIDRIEHHPDDEDEAASSSSCRAAAGAADSIPSSQSPPNDRPSCITECRLIVLQITDVYTLEHLASFKTLVESTKRNNPGAKVVSVLTGDFLSPYLLSAIDQGKGMMHALNSIPLDYLTWGNHEADIKHATVCRHVRQFKGTAWLNSNMLDHEAMDAQQEYDIIALQSEDGSNSRKVGLVAVLSDDPKLYANFKSPGAFGGATITDPWDALGKYQSMLQAEPYCCDMILPFQHLYVPDDHKTCQTFDFPVILSGHDHHRVDEVVEGTRLLKPGMNAVYATRLEISWQNDDNSNNAQQTPTIRAKFVKCSDWEPDPVLDDENERAYDALEPLRNTELARVPSKYEPLSSNNSRGSVCTMGTFICSLLRSSLSVTRRQRFFQVDAVLLMGGNIRGNAVHPEGSFFSLEALEAEIKDNEVIAVLPMPGWLLADGIQETHKGDPIPGWMQYDHGVVEDTSVFPPVVTHVANKTLDRDRIYRVATKIGDLTNGQSPSWTDYYKAHPESIPPKGAYINIHSELMSYFGRNLWRKLWDAMTEIIKKDAQLDEGKCYPTFRLGTLDTNGDGTVTVQEIQQALNDLLGVSTDDREPTLAEFVHTFADTTGDGVVNSQDFEQFCGEMMETYERDSWRLSHLKRSSTV